MLRLCTIQNGGYAEREREMCIIDIAWLNSPNSISKCCTPATATAKATATERNKKKKQFLAVFCAGTMAIMNACRRRRYRRRCRKCSVHVRCIRLFFFYSMQILRVYFAVAVVFNPLRAMISVIFSLFSHSLKYRNDSSRNHDFFVCNYTVARRSALTVLRRLTMTQPMIACARVIRRCQSTSENPWKKIPKKIQNPIGARSFIPFHFFFLLIPCLHFHLVGSNTM